MPPCTARSEIAVPRPPRKRLSVHDNIVGQVLRAARRATGLSQGDVAMLLGAKPQSYVSKTEQGRRHLHEHELEQFARVLGLSPQELWRRITLALPAPPGRPRRVGRDRWEQRLAAGERVGLIDPKDAQRAEQQRELEAAAQRESDMAPGATPLRPAGIPYHLPTLSPADAWRRARLSELVKERAAAWIGGLRLDYVDVLDAFGPDGTTPLYEATAAGFDDVVEELIALGADPFKLQCFPWAVDAREVTPVNAAIRLGDKDLLKHLLKNFTAGSSAAEQRVELIHWSLVRTHERGEELEAVLRAHGFPDPAAPVPRTED